jgi:hypothetical protein
MEDIKKWFRRWDAVHLLNDRPRDFSMIQVFLQKQCIAEWERCGGSQFIHYTTVVVPNYKTKFFSKSGNRMYGYMLEPILLYDIIMIASIRVSFDSRQCKIGGWDIIENTSQLCILCLEQIRESRYRTLLQCSAFNHIRMCFPCIPN